MLSPRFQPQTGDVVEVIAGIHHGALYIVVEIVDHKARLSRTVNDYRTWEDEANIIVRWRPGVL